MKRLFYLCLLSFFTIACSGNLVKNPGAENLPLTNEWTIASGKWTQRNRAPAPQEGKVYFFPSVAEHAEIFQDVDVSSYKLFTDLGVMKVGYTAYMRSFPQRPPDQSYEVLEFRNADSVVVDSFATARSDSVKSWMKVMYSQPIPKATRIIRVRLLSDRYNGSNNDGYHDGISLTITLAWWVYVVLIVVVVGIVLVFIRKKQK